QASLTVYNMLGQEVAVVANKRFNAGEHSVNFDASALASGIYIYRLQSGSQTLTKQMTLIK
ncbi:MAG TPA: peptidase S8, partial [Balneolaceae bacterium]|nr:peptidase S8 [Balneolaceae bacterium]